MNDKIILQNFANAFLINNGNYLIMKRSPNKKLIPNKWAGIGGHIEPDEMNDPISACLREVYEETGITKEHIFNLRLKYIILRRAKNIIRQNYVYFGETDVTDIVGNDEGTLHWIDEPELLNKDFTQTFKEMLKHYFLADKYEERVIIGVAENTNGKLKMNWSVIEDFE